MTTPTTFEELRSKKKRRTETIYMSTDTDTAMELEEAERNLKAKTTIFNARGDNNEAVAKEYLEAVERRDRAVAAANEHSIKFVFQSLGHKPYERLVRAHPLDEEVKKEIVEAGEDPEQFAYHPRTFPPVLISKSVIEPEISEQEMFDWIESDDWNDAEVAALFTAALAANTMRRRIDAAGNGSKGIQI